MSSSTAASASGERPSSRRGHGQSLPRTARWAPVPLDQVLDLLAVEGCRRSGPGGLLVRPAADQVRLRLLRRWYLPKGQGITVRSATSVVTGRRTRPGRRRGREPQEIVSMSPTRATRPAARPGRSSPLTAAGHEVSAQEAAVDGHDHSGDVGTRARLAIADPASIELVLDASAPESDRLTAARRLGVVPRHVVDGEAADRRSAAERGVGAVMVVGVQPAGQGLGPL